MHIAILQNDESKFDEILNRPEVQSEIKTIDLWQNWQDPYHQTVCDGKDSMLIKLLDSGAKVDSLWVDDNDERMKCTALHWAVFYDRVSTVKILIKYGANQHLFGKIGIIALPNSRL